MANYSLYEDPRRREEEQLDPAQNAMGPDMAQAAPQQTDGATGNQPMTYAGLGAAPSGSTPKPATTEGTISQIMDKMAGYEQILDPYGKDVAGLAAQMKYYGDFDDPYRQDMDAKYRDILGRQPFSYDYRSDPLYAQYADEYTRLGRRAMDDTMAKLSARTGGLASSYAAAAGNQAYGNYMAQLGDKIPELYKLAYDMYSDEANRDRADMDMIRGMSGDAYNRWMNGYDMLGSNLSAFRGLSQDYYGRQQDAYNRLGDLYNLAYNERRYADSRSDLDYERAWNEDERARQRAAEDEAKTVYGYGSDGSSYEITSKQGRDFIANAKYGDPDMTGGDGSVWHKNKDGSITITRTNGQTYTVPGTPEEPKLTMAQTLEQVKKGNLAPNVLDAWEYYFGAPYGETGGALAGGRGYTGGGNDDDEEEDGDYPVDMASVEALGYGPISAERVFELVESGDVDAYVEDGKWRFRRAGQTGGTQPLFTPGGSRLGKLGL